MKCALLVFNDYGELSYLVTGNGENISAFDISSLALGEGQADTLGMTDAHAHDVTSLAVWKRPLDSDTNVASGRTETWIVSGSLDGTIRKWKLTGLVIIY